MFSNLVAALLTYERIRTTDVKAKETRRLAERAITWARRLGDVLTKKVEKRSDEEQARVVHAIRMALRTVRSREAVLKLFEEIAPRYLTRHGGYTRIVKIGQRPGDAAPMSLLELIPAEAGADGPKVKEPGEAKVKKDPAKKAAAKGGPTGRAKPAAVKAGAPSPKLKKESLVRGGKPAAAAKRVSPRGKKGGE
jgi:large subunit ribosomal protein L17